MRITPSITYEGSLLDFKIPDENLEVYFFGYLKDGRKVRLELNNRTLAEYLSINGRAGRFCSFELHSTSSSNDEIEYHYKHVLKYRKIILQ